MPRIAIGLLVAFLVVSLIGCSSSSDPTCPTSGSTPSGGDGSSGNAYFINLSDVVEAFLADGAQDFYEFVPNSTSTHTGCVGSSDNADFALYLYGDGGGGPDFGNQLAECDNYFEGTDERCSTSEVGLSLLAGTSYYIEIYNWGPVQDNYTLTVSTP